VNQFQAVPGIFGEWSNDYAQQKQEVKMVKYQRRCSPPCSMATAHSYLHITENSKQVTSYRELGTQKEQNRIPNEQDQTIKVFTIGAA